ncbi:MAG: 1-acyl-sn-glycerol-3-phosphate acyltransferase [Acidobacteriota bacterium]|nr:1-acyl-sn-glycerol-3-phosphate acyltransferase [Acidobacteriota bacterium]
MRRLPRWDTEALIHATVRQVNTHAGLKRIAHGYLRRVGMTGVHYATRHLLTVANEDLLDTLPPDRGILVASNHRSFFDMFVIASVLLRRCAWIRRLYFPVRSEYFYERLDGLLVNLAVSGMSMYPPVYRDPARRLRNRDGISFLAEQLQTPGTVVGLHPEGRRNRSDDPYTLLPARPGIGDLVRRARPLVLPVFILGLRNHLGAQLRDNFRRTGPPITVTFGTAVPLDAYLEGPGGPRQSLRIAQAIGAAIEALGATDRQRRAT